MSDEVHWAVRIRKRRLANDVVIPTQALIMTKLHVQQ